MSASQSWNKAHIWGSRPDFYYCQTTAGLLMWGALSDERTGLPLTNAAGPRQRSHSHACLDFMLCNCNYLYLHCAVSVIDLVAIESAHK
jgi:hypothetical protein